MDQKDRLSLLQLARATIRAELSRTEMPSLPPGLSSPAEEFGGVFVTLKTAGRLRGCIGRFHPEAPLPETVQKMAAAALNDPRFRAHPVTLDELPSLSIEISVLSAMKRTDQPLELQPGVHGVFLRQGTRSGCFLPQVAPEQNWDAEQMLSQCCSGKAGLPADAWKDPHTEVYLFTAEVFGDRDCVE